ncbi:hypothetical protein ACJX0J_025674, partial [Zea mays]
SVLSHAAQVKNTLLLPITKHSEHDQSIKLGCHKIRILLAENMSLGATADECLFLAFKEQKEHLKERGFSLMCLLCLMYASYFSLHTPSKLIRHKFMSNILIDLACFFQEEGRTLHMFSPPQPVVEEAPFTGIHFMDTRWATRMSQGKSGNDLFMTFIYHFVHAIVNDTLHYCKYHAKLGRDFDWHYIANNKNVHNPKHFILFHNEKHLVLVIDDHNMNCGQGLIGRVGFTTMTTFLCLTSLVVQGFH